MNAAEYAAVTTRLALRLKQLACEDPDFPGIRWGALLEW